MLDALRKLITDFSDEGHHPSRFRDDDYRLAACALLVHTATIDGAFSDSERRSLHGLVMQRFRLDDAIGDQYLAELEPFIVRRLKKNGVEFVAIDDSRPAWKAMIKKYGGTCVQPIEINITLQRPPGTCQRCGSKEHDISQCPIPSDFDAEAERRRLLQGGCCGEPSKPLE